MNRNERLDSHQKFKELAALAQRGALGQSERLELESHLQICSACQQVYDEYALISAGGMSFLAAAYGHDSQGWDRNWDERSVRDRLLARVRDEQGQNERGQSVRMMPTMVAAKKSFVPWGARAQWAAVAAGVLIAVAVGAYELGGRATVAGRGPSSEIAVPSPAVPGVSDRNASDELIASENAQLVHLQAEVSSGQRDITRLRDELRAAESRSAALAAASSANNAQLLQVSAQRDQLASRLREAEQSYQVVQAELTTLRAERDRVLLRMTSLESKVDELNASAREQDRRVKDDEQYLASDRDIRELMGARKLYIADVFDVDSGSRTRKPFGRVFYTESKSLIFYAFDLDHQPGVKNASAFQVWGQKDAESEKIHATNLGILYMDSESSRRWVLRLDDPKQLSEIDSVFVTVEPQGGSQKPTGKPFLYALLRREANHP
jgi:hypothetical protein